MNDITTGTVKEEKIIHPNNINISISKNVSRIRKERKLSLDQTAELTGVSKAMLGQIERGETNPTVTTLWKIANGLHVSFSSLIKEEAPLVTVVSKKNAITEDDGNYRVHSLFPFDSKKQFEIYSIELEPGCSHESEAHYDGVEEYVLVSEGVLELSMEREQYIIEPEMSVMFQANRPHTYRNVGTSTVKFFNIIHYPN
ncbi:helix-turn-helix domain-containing protein [Paenibacillus agri]|uniref:Helix-turn-helix transcriptional regulator n=1 Tax=Paenibacillus agri TaxID=2744309 RepID=A0A850ERE1_9BACL|nr:XRE family transcriptional regulator [Paenibacillus agri]NUU62309.1 helix-turn-helix transcriptional regulator [Paenibacillus agri]